MAVPMASPAPRGLRGGAAGTAALFLDAGWQKRLCRSVKYLVMRFPVRIESRIGYDYFFSTNREHILSRVDDKAFVFDPITDFDAAYFLDSKDVRAAYELYS